MYFKHPEVLYFLLLLVVPIIVHLFQFRRFQKEYFTNVRFLKEISIKSRKSSTIKKWLLLCTRLLAMAALIIAFAQPYFEAKDKVGQTNELVVILDNSYSMQAKGGEGELLQRAIQNIIAEVPNDQIISILTNDERYLHTSINSIKNELLQTPYSSTVFSIQKQLDQVQQYFPKGGCDVVVVSDAQNWKQRGALAVGSSVYWIQPESIEQFNASVDSVYIASNNNGYLDLRIQMSSYGSGVSPVTLSVYDRGKTIAKSAVSFSKEEEAVSISIPDTNFHGYVHINDGGLVYDNSYYFSILEKELINVMSIGSVADNSFLERIFTADEFSLKSVSLDAIPYGMIHNQDVLVLNELSAIPMTLQNSIIDFSKKGGVVVFIPSSQLALQSLNQLIDKIGGFRFGAYENQEHLVTQINFENDLYKNVFEKKISNFQYPKVAGRYSQKGIAQTVLAYADNTPFLVSTIQGSSPVYVFTAPINTLESNFKNSPLVVPTFYKMAKEIQTNLVSFNLNEKNTLTVKAKLASDEVLRVKGTQSNFIPLQKIGADKVRIEFVSEGYNAGNYSINNKDEEVGVVSFNNSRTESNIFQKKDLSLTQFNQVESITSVLDVFEANRKDNEIWRWLLVLTLVFLMFEILIQKIVK